MGNFQIVNLKGKKSYTVFEKNSFRNILALERELPMYNFIGEGRFQIVELFLDSPNNLLASAGIILCKVVVGSKAFFRIERENALFGKSFAEKKVYIHPIKPGDVVEDHSLFVKDGITSLLSTKFSIDFDNILKNVVPKIEITTKVDSFKILSGTGFKGVMQFEDVKIKNNFTKRKAELYMMSVEQTSSLTSTEEFDNFIQKIEKYCKEITPTTNSRYEIAEKLTKQREDMWYNCYINIVKRRKYD